MIDEANEKTNGSTRLKDLLYLVGILLVSMTLFNLLTIGLWSLFQIDMNSVLEGEELGLQQRNIFRIGLLLNHAGMFLIPGLIFTYYFIKKPISFFKLERSPDILSVVGWGLVILASYPLIAKLTIWNTSIPLPDWMSSSQSDAFALIEQTLQMTNAGELAVSILLVGVFAALGEELIFRGIVQKYLINHLKNPHLAIVLASVVFGGFHMQFERIIPLSLLGLLLGYSYYFSKNLWVPIVLHFIK